MKSKDGGPAFPVNNPLEYANVVDSDALWLQRMKSGMSLRDWYAGMALQGYFAGLLANEKTVVADLKADQAAKVCFAISDAMLAEREKEGK